MARVWGGKLIIVQKREKDQWNYTSGSVARENRMAIYSQANSKNTFNLKNAHRSVTCILICQCSTLNSNLIDAG